MTASSSYPRWATTPSSTTFVKFFALCWFSHQIGHCYSYRPPLGHRDIAGLWKLTQSKPQRPPTSVYYPMKEFTVYPKDKERQMKRAAELLASAKNEAEEEEILLMLKEDGSFQQYAQDGDNVVVPDKLKYHDDDDAVLERYFGNIKGQWDYVDGKLYLAAERPKNIPVPEDTLLVGQVVATSGESLQGNPILMQSNETTQEDIPTEAASATTSGSGNIGNGNEKKAGVKNTAETMTAGDEDTHLSVPQGEVNVGKFTYPKKHPAFFDQPMFHPRPKGSFQLKQVLGSLNTQSREEENELIEKFRVKDFYDKLFLLTAHPIGEYKPKGNIRWSIKYNKFVEDPPKKSKKQEEEEASRPAMIRVMEVKFFSNNTFATVAGLGGNILRGKFDVIGHDRDQLWMQIWRFGFGRSVSGSVYSEGKSLTKEDEKSYWGTISFEDEDDDGNEGNDDSPTTNASNNKDKSDDETTDGHPPIKKRLQVKGSVIYGSGLEPIPVARFIMREATELEMEDDEEDDDDDDDDDDNFKPPDLDITDGGIDYTDAFQ